MSCKCHDFIGVENGNRIGLKHGTDSSTYSTSPPNGYLSLNPYKRQIGGGDQPHSQGFLPFEIGGSGHPGNEVECGLGCHILTTNVYLNHILSQFPSEQKSNELETYRFLPISLISSPQEGSQSVCVLTGFELMYVKYWLKLRVIE